MTYLIEFVQKLNQLASEERLAVLDDPWRFSELAHSFSVKGAPPMREALLYLVHPDSFEPIVSSRAKERVAAAFADRVRRSDLDIDRRILEIRRSLEEVHGPELSFYSTPATSDQWQPESSRWGQFVMWSKRFVEEEGFDAEERDYKLLTADRLRLPHS